MPGGKIRSHFDAQASGQPTRTAVLTDDSSVTCAELEKAAHGFVHDLRSTTATRGVTSQKICGSSRVAKFGSSGTSAYPPQRAERGNRERALLGSVTAKTSRRPMSSVRTRHASLAWRVERLLVIEVDGRSVVRWGERGASQGLSAFPDVEPNDIALTSTYLARRAGRRQSSTPNGCTTMRGVPDLAVVLE
jgi:hypothetical protein